MAPDGLTATELLMKMMERFGEHEPTDIVIAFVAQDGNIHMAHNTHTAMAVGMLEIAKRTQLSSCGEIDRE